MMKKLLLFVLSATLGFGQVANDLILTQRKSDNSGNIQRNVSPTANAALGVNASKVPVALAAFTQDSATGAVTVAAQGSNQNVTIAPSGTGNGVVAAGVSAASLAAPRFQGLQVAAGNDVRTSFYMDAVGTNGPTFAGRRAKGTYGSLTGVVANDTLAQYTAEGYGATGYVNTRPGIIIAADDTWTDSVAGSKTFLSVTLKGGTTSYNSITLLSNGAIGTGGTARTIPAWTNTGAILEVPSVTITDSTSSGTVATAVANRFSTPTFAASSATTFTDAFNSLLIGPVAAGTNVTLTRPHTLGIVDSTSASSSITGGLVVSAALGTTATSVGIGGGNVNAGGTITSGGAMTSGGTLTASNTFTVTTGASSLKQTTIAGAAATTALTVTQTARTSGVLPYITWTIPTDTGQTASTESPGLKAVTGTRTWATTGTVALQRENYFAGPTYASASASQTFTDVFTMYVDAPTAGTNAIFTRKHTFGVVDSTAATSPITGGMIVATTLGTSATSVGIGGGAVYAGAEIKSTSATAGVGYGTGSGGTVTQATNRTTGVTLNTVTGAITLVSAAGSASYQSFTVTNSAVAATDVVIVNQKSGTDKYIVMVTNVAAGSFQITFATTGGTTTEQPVFQFAVLKGSNN